MNATFNLSIAASVLLAAVSTASAQNLKAEVPFAFDAGTTHMQAGAYSVIWQSTNSGVPLMQLRSEENRSSVLMVGRNEYSATPAGPLALRFACVDTYCVLAAIRTSTTVYSFPAAKITPETRIATVLLKPDRSE